jgi:hypothetical protein
MAMKLGVFVEDSHKQARAGLLRSGVDEVPGARQRRSDKSPYEDDGKRGTSPHPVADTPADWRHSQRLTMVIVSGHIQKAESGFGRVFGNAGGNSPDPTEKFTEKGR